MLLRFMILTFGLASASSAWAQIDPSSALLLNSGRGTNNALDSGRYTIRPKSEQTKKEESRTAKKTRDDDSNEPVTVTVPAGQTIEAIPTQPQVPVAQPLIIRCEQSENCAQAVAVQAPPRDSGRRLNLIDLSFAPGYMYNFSDSNYSYRSYTYSTPTLNVDANVWLSQTFGLHGSYMGTLSGQITDSANGSKNVPATQEWFTAGIRSRKFINSSALSPVLTFGVDYYEFQFRVPQDAVLREKLRSSGFRLTLDAEIPVNENRAWTAGVTLAPKLHHTELSTGIDFQSGGNVEANSVGISVGGRVQFEREDAIYWKFTQIVEKDLFSGDASKVDTNGLTPSGVAVTNSFSLFELGYTWGN
jgi:hypothetical protein